MEHCSGCGGIRLDENEWKALEARNLHDEIHRIFSTACQNQIREEKLQARIEDACRNQFGDETYSRIHGIKKWLQAHPQKALLLAYLREE